MPEHARKLLGSYEGLRGYHMLPEAGTTALAPAAIELRIAEVAGLTHSAQLSQVRASSRGATGAKGSLPGGPARSGSAAGRSSRTQFVAAADGGGVVGGAARSAARECDRAVRHQRASQTADAAHAGARQAHRQRVRGGGTVLSDVQDHAPSAHEHGEGRAQHDDAHRRRRITSPTAST